MLELKTLGLARGDWRSWKKGISQIRIHPRSWICTIRQCNQPDHGLLTYTKHNQPSFDCCRDALSQTQYQILCNLQFLFFRSARTSCTTFGWFVRPAPSVPQEKYGLLYYTGIYALWIMNRLIKPTLWPHGIPWMPSRPPGTPWQPPNRPPQTHKQVS